MSLQFHLGSDQSSVKIRVSGSFGFDDLGEFRQVLHACKATIPVIVDLSQCDDLDTAALGMLAILDERGSTDGFEVRVVGCNGRPREIIELTPLHHLLSN